MYCLRGSFGPENQLISEHIYDIVDAFLKWNLSKGHIGTESEYCYRNISTTTVLLSTPTWFQTIQFGFFFGDMYVLYDVWR